MRRIALLMITLAAAGTLAWLAFRGGRAALSFLTGAAVSGVSFWWLQHMVAGLEKAVRDGKTPGGKAALHALRIFLLGGSLYVILKLYEVHVPALVTGLLVTVAAITLEAVRELIYAPRA